MARTASERSSAVRIDAVVFDGVAEAHHLATMETGHGAQHRDLHLSRQARTHTLHIHLVCAEALRLDEDLVPVFVRKAHELVLDARAIARAGGVDLSAVDCGSMKVIENHAVRIRIGVGEVEYGACSRESLPLRNENAGIGTSPSCRSISSNQREPVDARGRTRFKPLERHAEFFQRVRERLGTQKPRRPAVAHEIADQNPALHTPVY